MTVAILGCTGYVGNRFVRSLKSTAPEIVVRAIGRNRTKLRTLKANANVADVRIWEQGTDLGEVLAGADACVDLSFGLSGIPSEVIRKASAHARNLIETAHKNGIRKVIIVGSIAVYGEPLIQYPWEESPSPAQLHPNTLYGRSKAVVEAVAFKYARRLGVELALVRSGHILGPGSKMAANIAGQILAGGATRLEHLSAPSNATTIEGLNGTLLALLQNENTSAPIVGNHVDLADMSYDKIVDHVADALGLDATICPLPNHQTKRSLHQNLFRFIRSRQKKILYMQSFVGRYDMGVSARLLHHLKPSYSSAVIRWNGSQYAAATPSALVPLYESNPVPHSSEIFGQTIKGRILDEALKDVTRWLRSAGFSIPDQA